MGHVHPEVSGFGVYDELDHPTPERMDMINAWDDTPAVLDHHYFRWNAQQVRRVFFLLEAIS